MLPVPPKTTLSSLGETVIKKSGIGIGALFILALAFFIMTIALAAGVDQLYFLTNHSADQYNSINSALSCLGVALVCEIIVLAIVIRSRKKSRISTAGSVKLPVSTAGFVHKRPPQSQDYTFSDHESAITLNTDEIDFGGNPPGKIGYDEISSVSLATFFKSNGLLIHLRDKSSFLLTFLNENDARNIIPYIPHRAFAGAILGNAVPKISKVDKNIAGFTAVLQSKGVNTSSAQGTSEQAVMMIGRRFAYLWPFVVIVITYLIELNEAFFFLYWPIGFAMLLLPSRTGKNSEANNR